MLYRPPGNITHRQQPDQTQKQHVEQGEEEFTRRIDDDVHQIAGSGLILLSARGEHPHIAAREAQAGDDGDTTREE